jgi:hypothetical protein
MKIPPASHQLTDELNTVRLGMEMIAIMTALLPGPMRHSDERADPDGEQV